MMFFFFSFSFLNLFSTKLENRRAEQVLPEGRDGTTGREEVVGKGGRRVNTYSAKNIHMNVNAKKITVETVPGIKEGRIKERSGGGEFKYDIFDTL
jgi:hypothetical protein